MYELICKMMGLPVDTQVYIGWVTHQLTQAWHDDDHNGTWQPDLCYICREEMTTTYGEIPT